MIDVIASGNGTAYVDNPVAGPGDSFTLYAYPDPGSELEDITAIDANGYYIAMQQTEEWTYTYQSGYGAYITIFVTFTGGTPPVTRFPWWFIIGMKKNNQKALDRWRRN